MKKTLYTLDVGQSYARDITALTFPLMLGYAQKIGAEFVILTERRFPDWPVNMEKFQVADYARAHPADWHLFFDADTVIHPDTPDWTLAIAKDTVAHNGADYASVRWKMDEVFRRDGRQIGSCTWCVLCSDWCLDLWNWPTLTLEESLARIQPTLRERKSGIDAAHLLDDYWLSRNIARYGLKFTTLISHERQASTGDSQFFWHAYALSQEEKLRQMREVLVNWGLA